MKEQLKEIMDKFEVKASYEEHVGPAVTRVDVRLDKTPILKVKELEEDIYLQLGTRDIRIISPSLEVPYFSYEIPNKKRRFIRRSTSNGEGLDFVIGEGFDGKEIHLDLSKDTPLLIGGATGTGKSVCVDNILSALMRQVPPEELGMVVVDTNIVRINIDDDTPNLLLPKITDTKEALGALAWLAEETLRRKENPDGSYKKILFLIDEIVDLMMLYREEAEQYFRIIMFNKAQDLGIYLIVTTQRAAYPSIGGIMHGYFENVIAFTCEIASSAEVLTGETGAEKLLGMGDMLLYRYRSKPAIRGQIYMVYEEDFAEIIDFVKKKYGAGGGNSLIREYIVKFAEDKDAKEIENERLDNLFYVAGKLLIYEGETSERYLMKNLLIGYERAFRLLRQLRRYGLYKKEGEESQILLTIDEFDELYKKLQQNQFDDAEDE